MTEKKHAVRAPSSAKRRRLCPGSPVIEAGRPDNANKFSAEGTCAHQLMEMCLTQGLMAEAFEGRTLEADGFQFEVGSEMVESVNTFIALVHDYYDPAAGDQLFVENAVSIEHITGEKDAEGTADVIVVREDGTHLVVIDLKYGRGVRVFAKKEVEDELTGQTVEELNDQLVDYSSGALEDFAMLFDISRVTGVIAQPRLEWVDDFDVTVEALELAVEGRRRVERECDAVVAACIPGFDILPFLHPSEEACKFCKGKAVCPALAGEVAEAVSDGRCSLDDFADLTSVTEARIVDPAACYTLPLATMMAKVPLVEEWCTAIRAEVQRELFAGNEVEGFKVVAGRKGSRAWQDEAAAAAEMKKARLKRDEMFTEKLISPTAAEKVLKEKPKVWAKLAPLIVQSDGQPSVAPASDKRPALDMTASLSDFDDLTAGDDGSDLV